MADRYEYHKIMDPKTKRCAIRIMRNGREYCKLPRVWAWSATDKAEQEAREFIARLADPNQSDD